MSHEEVMDDSNDLNSSTESEVEDQDSTDEEKQEPKAVPYNRFKEVNDKAKKLEEEIAKFKSKDPKEAKPDTQLSDSTLSREEAVLIAKGLEIEELEKVSKIAQLEGMSLIDAAKSDLFQAWKFNQEAEAKKAEAKLGASKGSGSKKKEKDFNTPGLSSEDHKALFNKVVGR